VSFRATAWIASFVLLGSGPAHSRGQAPAGTLRGVVLDADFDVPLGGASVQNVETGQRVLTTDQGAWVMSPVPPGRYTLVFSKDGYLRQVRADVLVVASQLTDVDVALEGEFTELEELVVQDLFRADSASEIALLSLRFEAPALMDSIGAELMSLAGASDAASALRLVSGASLQDGKSAVIRGLPDRYVSSQMNGVRLPSADADKRAVELDQFPAAVIESLRVTKTFTPDQQGDASGGAVDVVLKGIPDQNTIEFKLQGTYDSQASGLDEFLTYDGGGVDFWGRDDGGRDIQYENLGSNWDGAAGVSTGDSPPIYKWALSGGGSFEVGQGVKLGGFASFFYERDASYYDDGVNNSYWVETPGAPLTPETIQGTPGKGNSGDYKTALFDVTESSQSVQWGGLGTLGLETERHQLGLTFLYTHTAEDKVTLAEDTRGKEYFFPGYDPNDPTGPGNTQDTRFAAPYLRTETLEYTERTTSTLQLNGRHTFPVEGYDVGPLRFSAFEVDWVAALSSADLDQPDKRQFASLWAAPSFSPGFPPFVPPFTAPATWYPYLPAANFNLGNFQRIWTAIEEDGNQLALNLKMPFTQWGEDEGYLKFGAFADRVDRTFDQETFSNFGDAGASFPGEFDEFWSAVFPDEDHPISASSFDVDYTGNLDVTAFYGMLDLPLSGALDLIGGARFESTDIGVVNDPEKGATWLPPGAQAPVELNPGDADVDFSQDDVLPSVGLVYEPFEKVTLRGSFGQTVARQTFKELTPIQQQEFSGGPVFIGNPDLGMSNVDNWDLRADWRPVEQGLVSLSWFYKDITDPIEYVQAIGPGFTYTTPVNYPEGQLSGIEFELRQGLGVLWESLAGLSLGANGTLIDSEVTLPEDEQADFELPEIQAPMSTRDMTNAPEYLVNLYLTYDIAATDTQLGLFYTRQGDTLVAGAGQADGNFVPSVYATAYDTLNFSLTQKLGKYFKLQFQAKNLTNPEIQEVYRSEYTGDDVLKTSETRGIEYSLSLGAEIAF
jgi:outer membrane receptor protein involved in Fe transport